MAEVVEVGPTCRLHGTTAVKQISYGNRAGCLPTREDSDPTHLWTVYLKPFKKEDLSIIVKEVHFKFHESYANSKTVVTKPPYQMTGTGCSEFTITIEIFFRDPFESSLFTSPSQMMYELLTKTGANSFRILGDERKYKEIAEKHHCTVLAVATTSKREVLKLKKD